MAVRSYEELDVWQISIDLVMDVYKIVKFLPKEELYALSDQIRRAVVSIPSNIAEGQQRMSAKDFIRFLAISKGSLAELKTQIIVAERLKFLTAEQSHPILQKCDTVGRMINGLIRSILENPNLYQHPALANQKPATSNQQPK